MKPPSLKKRAEPLQLKNLLKKDYSRIQRIWYDKLKQTGFDDIEQGGGVRLYDRRTQGFLDQDQILGFFRKLDAYLTSSPNIPKEHIRILELYSEGFHRTEIISLLDLKSEYDVNKVFYYYKDMINSYDEDTFDQDAKSWDVREPIKSDIPFIYSSWLKSYKLNSIFKCHVSNRIYYRDYLSVIDNILSEEDTQIRVACSKEQRDVVFGYIVYSKNIVHYIFVKEPFRNFGIAKDLYQKANCPKECTHKTQSVDKFLGHYGLIYSPFLLYKMKFIKREFNDV